MKKIFYSLFALAVSALALQSCEDVPAPYDIPGSGDKPTVIEPAGNGTETDPYNIAGIIKATENLNSGETLPEKVYFTGVVTSVKECSPSYGNATFYLGDDIESTKTFYVYQCLGLGNKNIASEDEVQVGDTITIYGSITNYNGTIETAKKDAYIYKSSRNGSSEPVGEGEPKGSGTLEDPYNSVAANKVAAALSSTEQSGVVYVKGKVVSIKEQYSTQFGNASYYISDDGTSAGQFYVFRSMYLGNKKYSSGDLLKEGDEVIVCGKLMNYMGNTPETVQNESYLYSLNGKTEGGGTSDAGTPKGSGTQADPFNVAGVIKYTSALDADEQSSGNVYFKGIVSNAKDISTTHKNATFYISEDGSANNEFYVFRAKGLNGADITSSDDVRKGDEVVICGKVVNYKGNTPETVQNEAYIVSIKHNSEPGGGNTGGEVGENSITVEPISFGLENGTAVVDIKLADGTELTFDGGGNTNAPKFYTTGNNIRMYPKNSMKIKSAKTIQSVVLTCDVASGVVCNASGDISASYGSVNVENATVTVSGVNAKETTITNTSATTGTASQIRWIKLVINYAE